MFNSSKVKVDFDESKISVDDITKSIVKLGYEVKKVQVKQIKCFTILVIGIVTIKSKLLWLLTKKRDLFCQKNPLFDIKQLTNKQLNSILYIP